MHQVSRQTLPASVLEDTPMRLRYLLLALGLSCLAAGGSGKTLRAGDEPAPGRLIVVKTRIFEGVVEAHPGDLIRFSVGSITAPGHRIPGLKVEVSGEELTPVGVVNRDLELPEEKQDGPSAGKGSIKVTTLRKERVEGGGEISAFVRADREGRATVTLTPEARKAKPMTFEVKVSPRPSGQAQP
jgi:hypothetical protein